MRLKIFSSKEYLPDGCMPVQLLEPFWPGQSIEGHQEMNLQFGRLDKYSQAAKHIFELTGIEDANIGVFPGPWEICRSAQGVLKLGAFLSLCNQYGKKAVVFVGGDLLADVPFKDVILFHTSLYASTRQPTHFGMPAFVDDLVTKHFDGKLPLKTKAKTPTIGFCGTAPPLAMPVGKKRVKERLRLIVYCLGLLKYRPHLSGYSPRAKAIKRLLKSKKITSNIILKHFSPIKWAYGFLLPNEGFEFKKNRDEFIKNLLENDYILCVRGNGNYSLRLYETLCVGRIPVIVNTGIVLPYEAELPWKEFCVWVEEKDIDKVDEIVLDFHRKLTKEAYLQMQKKCRVVWENWLSSAGFFNHFYMHFIDDTK